MTGPEPWCAADGGPGIRRHAPATVRNRDVITQVLHGILPPDGLLLELASGSGEHILHFAAAFPSIAWQPSDPDPDARRSIAVWTQDAPNVRPPLGIDAAKPEWPIGRADAILCINMVHISPWAATVGLFEGAARLLGTGQPLYLYGPYLRDGVQTTQSNIAFDRSLRSRDPDWGLRALEDVAALAGRHGFALETVIEMPANNLSVIFRKAG